MKPELDPQAVAARLAELKARYVPESVEAARERLERERPRVNQTIEQVATRSLAELRALCDLARHLHRAGSSPRES